MNELEQAIADARQYVLEYERDAAVAPPRLYASYRVSKALLALVEQSQRRAEPVRPAAAP